MIGIYFNEIKIINDDDDDDDIIDIRYNDDDDIIDIRYNDLNDGGWFFFKNIYFCLLELVIV